MADDRTMAELLQAPTEGYEDAIVILEIAANNFELKHGLINLFQNKQFFGHDKEDPHAHIRYFNKITSTIRVDMKRIQLKRDKSEQNRIKTRQKREAWRSPEESRVVSVDRARKTEENAKRMVENANTVEKLLEF
nr:reverse transcriptase domain-containing protein [Tanacetum cinerariifolium]